MNSISKQQFGSTAQRGIGFVEILIAVFVISLAVLGLGQMISTSSETAANSKAQSEGLAVAELHLEQLRNYATYDEYNTGIVSATALSVNGTNASFTPSWTATPSTVTDPVTDPLYRTVTVDVAWAGTESAEEVELTTIIAQEQPVEAGAKLLSLAEGDKPDFDTVYDPPSDPNDTTTPTDVTDPNCTTCTDISTDVYTDDVLLGDVVNGINVFGTIDTSNANEKILSVQATGNFALVPDCPPTQNVAGGVQQYECNIGPTTSGDPTIWNVTITVTVRDQSNFDCVASNVYTLGNLQYLNNYFPLIGSLTTPPLPC